MHSSTLQEVLGLVAEHLQVGDLKNLALTSSAVKVHLS